MYNHINLLIDTKKMEDRFDRCDTFLEYLTTEENNELSVIKNISSQSFLLKSFMEKINICYVKSKGKIQTRLGRYYSN